MQGLAEQIMPSYTRHRLPDSLLLIRQSGWSTAYVYSLELIHRFSGRAQKAMMHDHMKAVRVWSSPLLKSLFRLEGVVVCRGGSRVDEY